MKDHSHETGNGVSLDLHLRAILMSRAASERCDFVPLLQRFNPAEPVVEKSVIL